MLATVADYTERFGPPANTDQIATLLDDASSLVRRVAKQTIDLVYDDVAVLDGAGDNVVFLPFQPVLDVSEVLVDGVAVSFDWNRDGVVQRTDGVFPNQLQAATVTYDHGENTPNWITNLVCVMAERALKHGVEGTVRSESFVDAYSVSYTGSAGIVGLAVDEVSELRALGVHKAIA